VLRGEWGVVLLVATLKLLLPVLSNGQYDFHRDELAVLDDARNLAWGYVAYPPLTPFVARLALLVFGPSVVGLRLFSALSQSLATVLGGLIARELGGKRLAIVLAAVVVAIAPVSMAMSTLFEYTAFDYLWWVLISYLFVRLLKSDDGRWWLGIGAAIGLGALTKYAIAFLVVGIAVGLLATRARRYLLTGWFWGGVAVALLIFLPNLVWQVQHQFISLSFLLSIHGRDVQNGRTSEYLVDQLRLAANPFTIPLWILGLNFLFFSEAGRRYRMLGWLSVAPIVLLFLSQGRGYYAAPAYPLLLAAGSVSLEGWLKTSGPVARRLTETVGVVMVATGTLIVLALGPFAPVDSPLGGFARGLNTDLGAEVGWHSLAAEVGRIYGALPDRTTATVAVLAGNYGEAGALDLYRSRYGLPRIISGVNSYWARGYGAPPPQTLIVVGFDRADATRYFGTCDLAGHNTNRYGIANEETTDDPDIFVCRNPRANWPQLWSELRSFG